MDTRLKAYDLKRKCAVTLLNRIAGKQLQSNLLPSLKVFLLVRIIKRVVYSSLMQKVKCSYKLWTSINVTN